MRPGTSCSTAESQGRPEDFRRVFGELESAPLSVVFEATYGWHWFADLLADAGIEAHMAHPLATKAISSGRVKNDSVDAKTLAHLLRAHLLPEAWIAPPEVRDHRRLACARTSLVRIGARLRCQVRSALADRGITPPLDEIFGPTGRRFLASVELQPVIRGRVDAALRLIDAAAAEIATLDRELRAAFVGDERMHRLTAIPGIGFLGAGVILAEVGEVARFRSPDELCSWAGLTPTERSSDEHTRRGHISKQGSRWAALGDGRGRRELASQRGPGSLVRAHRAPAGKEDARVALARRLLTLCFYAARDDEGCRAFAVRVRASRQTRPGALAMVHGLR